MPSRGTSCTRSSPACGRSRRCPSSSSRTTCGRRRGWGSGWSSWAPGRAGSCANGRSTSRSRAPSSPPTSVRWPPRSPANCTRRSAAMVTDLHRGRRGARTGGQGGAAPGEDRAVVAGLDALDSVPQLPPRPGIGRVFVRSVLPPIVFLAALVGVWQLAYLAELKPPYALPSPADVAETFWTTVQDGRAAEAVWTSLSRGAVGFAMSLVIGTLL